MSSLYDKYYSDINKNYIYELSCNIIKEKYNTDISQDKYFKDIYIKNIDETFKTTDTEDIVVLNRKLLQLQITSYKSYNNNANNVNPIILNGANRIIEDTDSIYDFKIITPEGEYILESLMISQENNILFGNPVIIVNINSLDMYLKLSSSYKINELFNLCLKYSKEPQIYELPYEPATVHLLLICDLYVDGFLSKIK